MNDVGPNLREMPVTKAVLEASALCKTYDEAGKRVEVLRGVDLTVQAGDLVAITGTSGCGKSTLLNLLAGLDKPGGGHVSLCGHALADLNESALCRLRNHHLGFVFQFHHLLPEFTALENVAMPLLLAGTAPSAARGRAAALLGQVRLGERLAHKPGQLSGGERQRVAIARALVMQPDLVLADEPTGNLDEQTAIEVQDLLLSLNSELGTAFLIVTHDVHFAGRCRQRLRLHEGLLFQTD